MKSLSSTGLDVDLSLCTLYSYLLHRDDEAVKVEAIVEMMDTFRSNGYFAAWGVSNWRFERLREAVAFATSAGLAPPICDSTQFSLAEPCRPVWPGVRVPDRMVSLLVDNLYPLCNRRFGTHCMREYLILVCGFVYLSSRQHS